MKNIILSVVSWYISKAMISVKLTFWGMFSLCNVLEYRKNPIVFVNRVRWKIGKQMRGGFVSGSWLLVLQTFEMIRIRLSLGFKWNVTRSYGGNGGLYKTFSCTLHILEVAYYFGSSVFWSDKVCHLCLGFEAMSHGEKERTEDY